MLTVLKLSEFCWEPTVALLIRGGMGQNPMSRTCTNLACLYSILLHSQNVTQKILTKVQKMHLRPKKGRIKIHFHIEMEDTSTCEGE